MGGDSGISAFPEETYFAGNEQLKEKKHCFEGKGYNLSLAFPNDYPFKSPKVKFETACFHPKGLYKMGFY
ncbi:hypothetical protein GQ457_09G023050 [Hibiscus cannabinus]